MKQNLYKYGEKFISILITALLSAGIATLQHILEDRQNLTLATADPVDAGIIGGALRAAFEGIKKA